MRLRVLRKVAPDQGELAFTLQRFIPPDRWVPVEQFDTLDAAVARARGLISVVEVPAGHEVAWQHTDATPQGV